MDISRSFMLIGCLYLIVGISIGMYMGGSGDTDLAPLHAHINLLGFVLMMIFGLVYRAFPAMAAGALGRAHFWLHQVGALVLLVLLFLLLSGRIAEESMAPAAPIAELLILLGIATFAANLFTRAR